MEEKGVGEEGVSIPGEYGHPIPREIMLRELGFNGPFSRHSVGKAIVSSTLKTKAVHTMCTKNVLKKKVEYSSSFIYIPFNSNPFLVRTLNFLLVREQPSTWHLVLVTYTLYN
jgi:hypothetical protein